MSLNSYEKEEHTVLEKGIKLSFKRHKRDNLSGLLKGVFDPEQPLFTDIMAGDTKHGIAQLKKSGYNEDEISVIRAIISKATAEVLTDIYCVGEIHEIPTCVAVTDDDIFHGWYFTESIWTGNDVTLSGNDNFWSKVKVVALNKVNS